MKKANTMNDIEFVEFFLKINGQKIEDGLYKLQSVLVGPELMWLLQRTKMPYTKRGSNFYMVTKV